MYRLLSLVMLLSSSAMAFVAPSASTKSMALNMAPKYDSATQKWSPTSPEEEESAGYGKFKTLLLQGPKPFLQRILQPEDYNQAVLKFMAGEKCSRDVAQGNMDAFLENPNDWAYNRMYAEKNGIELNYTNLNKKQLVLTLVWASIVVFFGFRVAVQMTGAEKFWDFMY